MKKRFGGLLTAIIIILVCGLTACDSWMSGNHFFDTVADEVKYANAEKISVYVRYPTTTWGTTTPNGTSQQKVDIPFAISAIDNSEYGFYKWAAFSTAKYPPTNGRHDVKLVESEEKFEAEYGNWLLGEDEVVFENPRSESTTVRILNDRNDVFIMPVCVRKPYLSSSVPSNNQVDAAKNTTIQLVFSNPMDPECLFDENQTIDYTEDVIEGYLNKVNIVVEQVMSTGENPYNADITRKLRDVNGNLHTGEAQLSASLNKSRKTLTIKLPSGLYWPNGTIMVTVSQAIRDNLGFTMPNNGQITFKAGDDMDTIPPEVIRVETGTTTLVDNSEDGVYPRVGKKINIRAYITDKTKNNDTPSEGNVNKVQYYLYKNISTPSDAVAPAYCTYNVTSGDNDYSPAVNFTEADGKYPKAVLSSGQRGLGVVFQADYSGLNYTYDGLYKLVVCGVDNVGNPGDPDTPVKSTDDVAKPSKYVCFIRDTRAPSVSDLSSKITASNIQYAPYGWYGRDGLSHIEIKQTSAILDEPSQYSSYRSNKVWWAFHVGALSTWETDMKEDEAVWNASNWNEITSSPQELGAVDPDSVTDGSVTIYVLLKDDVGNVSQLGTLENVVKYDGTKPVTGTLDWVINGTNTQKGFTGNNILNTHTLAIPFTEVTSGIKKVTVEVEPPAGSGASAYEEVFGSTGTYAFEVYARSNSGSDYNQAFTTDTDKKELLLNTPITSGSYSTLYLKNLRIADNLSDLEDGDYKLKVKLYDAALNVADVKEITISVDSAAPVIQKMYIKDSVKFQASSTDTSPKLYLNKDSYDTSGNPVKATLQVKVKEEVSGLYTLTLSGNAAFTTQSTVTLKKSDGSTISAPNSITTSTNTVTFTSPRTARDVSGNPFTVEISNVSLGTYSSSSAAVTVIINDYATLSATKNNLNYESDATAVNYAYVYMDSSNRNASAPSSFTVKGGAADTYPYGYANSTNLARAILTLPSIGASGIKKIKLTGATATDTTTVSTTVTLPKTVDGDGNIVFNYPFTGTSPALTINNLTLVNPVEGSNTLTVKYEFLSGWESPATSTTLIYDTVSPVIGRGTENMKWTLYGTGTTGIINQAVVTNQYLVIPVTEATSTTGSGINKIEIEVTKPGGTPISNSCASIDYFGYSNGTSMASSPTDSIGYTADGNTITLTNPASYGKYNYYFIRGIRICEDPQSGTSIPEGNYTLHVTLYDYAGNVSEEKTITISNDSTKPVVNETYFDGIVNTALTPNRTFTTHSDNNTLFIDVTETGSGIQKIGLFHCTGDDPYTTGVSSCRNVETTSGTKLYKSTDNGLTYSQVTCSLSTGYVDSESAYILTIPQNEKITGTGVLLKITGLAIADPSYKNECAAAVGIRLYDFAANESTFGSSDKVIGKSMAGIIEDQYSPQVSTAYSIGDSGKHLNDSNALVATEGIPAASGYTKTPYVNMVFHVNEYAGNDKVTTCSGLRKIILEGAIFTPQTEIEFCQNTNVSFNGYGNAYYTLKFLEDKSSVEDCEFANTVPAGDTSEGGFYIVNGNTAVLRIPASVSQNTPLTIRYAKLSNTASDGEKTVKASFYDTARQLDTTADNQKTMTIKYCSTKPVIKVKATGGDPEAITAPDIQKLVPRNNGLQSYAEDTTAWVYSYSNQDNRNGAETTPSGNGVYIDKAYCPYFDLDITSSAVANLMSYAYTFDNPDIPASDSSDWNSTSSDKVNVTFPTYSSIVSNPPARDIYLHVADYAGNVTTKKMSVCSWINEVVSDPWPHRNSLGEAGKVMVDGNYYLEGGGFYNNSTTPKITVTFPAGTTGNKKIYIPPTWFDKVCDNGAPIYGYALGTHTRYGEGHTDISLAKRDANGPYLELTEDFYLSNNTEIFFYVYDAVGEDLTAVVKAYVDSTPPYLEVGMLKEGTDYDSSKRLLWKGADYSTDHKTRFRNNSNTTYTISRMNDPSYSNYEWSMSHGKTAADPMEVYVTTDTVPIMMWTSSDDIIKFKYSIDGTETEPTFAADESNWSSGFFDISGISPSGTLMSFSVVDKGSNVSSLYFKVYKDTVAPTVSINSFTGGSYYIGTSKVYFKDDTTKAKLSITDSGVGLSSSSWQNNEERQIYGKLDGSGKLYIDSGYISDALGNTQVYALTYNGKTFVLDNTPPVVSIDHTENCFDVGGTLYFKGGENSSNAARIYLRINDGDDGSGISSGTGSLQNGAEILMSDTNYYNSANNTIKIPSGMVKDNVGNTKEYPLFSNTVLDDTSPSAPSSITEVDPTGGQAYLSGNTLYFDGFTTAITLTLSGQSDSGSGLNGFNVTGATASAVTGYKTTKVQISTTGLGDSTSITIKAKDGVGNESTGYSVTLVKDAVKPSVSISEYTGTGVYTDSTSGKTYFRGTSAQAKLSIIDPSPSSGIHTSSLKNNDTVSLSAYYYDTTHSLTIGNNKIYDNVGNGKTNTYTLDSGKLYKDEDAPTISGVTVTSNGKVYFDSSTNTIYYNDSATTLTITPTASDGTNGSGIAGYSTSSTGTPQTSISLTSIGSSLTVYAFDKVGNVSTGYALSLVLDNSKPTVTVDYGTSLYTSGTNKYFKGSPEVTLTITEGGSGLNSASWQTGKTISLDSTYYNSTSKALVIPANSVYDNVENGKTDAYTFDAGKLIQDNDAPGAPTSVTATATGGTIYQDGTTIYYNKNSTSAITLTPAGSADVDGGSGLAGYAVSATGTPDDTITIITSTLGNSTQTTIYAIDKVGNASPAYTITLKNDVDAPTFNITQLPSITVAKVDGGASVNTFTSGATIKATITDAGSGPAFYAIVSKEGNYNYDGGEPSWSPITESSITVALPDTAHYNTNFMLLLKDKIGNITQASSGSYESAAIKNGSHGWWATVAGTQTFTAKYKNNGTSLEIKISGANFPVKKITVTGAGNVSGLNGNCKFKSPSGTYDANGTYNSGSISFNDNGYLSYDGSIEFTLNGSELQNPTAIKINDAVTPSSFVSFSMMSGFRRFSRADSETHGDMAGPELAPVAVRNVDFADYFGTSVQPLQEFAGEPISFNIGKNMAETQGIGEKPVIFDADLGYIDEASAAQIQDTESLAWKAPNGPVAEEENLENQSLAFNYAPEFDSVEKVLSGTDVYGSQVQASGGRWVALVLALISLGALGFLAVFLRKRKVN
ncbi:MAG: hypothetical protein J6Y60_13160 [Treponema sp.]|nr:hypothetical protein [Treponema sp.]